MESLLFVWKKLKMSQRTSGIYKILNAPFFYELTQNFFWKKDQNVSSIVEKTQKETFDIYLKKRALIINKSESKFRNEFIIDSIDTYSYYEALRKLVLYQDFQNLGNEQKVTYSKMFF